MIQKTDEGKMVRCVKAHNGFEVGQVKKATFAMAYFYGENWELNTKKVTPEILLNHRLMTAYEVITPGCKTFIDSKWVPVSNDDVGRFVNTLNTPVITLIIG